MKLNNHDLGFASHGNPYKILKKLGRNKMHTNGRVGQVHKEFEPRAFPRRAAMAKG